MFNHASTMTTERKEQIMLFVKYCMVGVINTLVTLIVIFICKSIIGINEYVSNGIGYVCGVINSFLWNKSWVFKSKGGYSKEAIRFFCGFAICYLLQLATVWIFNKFLIGDWIFVILSFTITGYGIATLIGNVVYTIANFIYNRFITFK